MQKRSSTPPAAIPDIIPDPIPDPAPKPRAESGPDGGRAREPDTEPDTTHFGFRTVAATEKEGLVRDVFDSVARRYDLMNDLMSGGIHRLWKTAMIDRLNPRPGMRVLDVGGGTGDIAFRILERGGGPVTIVDINAEMLSVGRDRGIDLSWVNGIDWICGDAERLPLADSSVDAVTTAFCLRNVTDIPRALVEAKRVLKPGGRFLCLEFSRVQLPVLDRVYDAYSFRVLPFLGRTVARDQGAYQYLAESIRRFPSQERFARMIGASGLAQVRYRNLSGGIACLHSAWRT
jgi:demethylmenaquinone methyltransferase / 2-methoxy-6-polyprenyl-1,4-benzoquinol methylase